MNFKEYERDLPKDLEVPYMRSKDSLKEDDIEHPDDFSNRGCYSGGVSGGYITLFDSQSLTKIDKPEKLFKIIEAHRHTFVIMSLKDFSILWKSFSEALQESITLDPNLWSKEDSWRIRRESPRKYSFVKGTKWYTLWILQVESSITEDAEKIVQEYLDLETVGLTPDPKGVSSIGRNFLFGPEGPGSYEEIREEFYYSRVLNKDNPEILKDIYNACKRPPMACRYLGETSPGWNKDMVKAWNTALMHSPTASPYNTSLDTTPTFDPDANHAVYLVKATLPQEWVFSPSLFRYGEEEGDYGVYSPTGGVQVIRIGQQLARLWTSLNIPFKVVKAWKLLPAGGLTYPFSLRCSMLEKFILDYQDQFPHINMKLFYQAGISSLLTLYSYHSQDGEDKSRTLVMFNPLHQLFVYEWVFCNNWLQLLKHPKDTHQALRIDATTFLDYPEFKQEGKDNFYRLDNSFPVPMFFPNPRQKDKNLLREAKYKIAVQEAASKGEEKVIMTSPTLGTLQMVIDKLIPLEKYGKDVYIKQVVNLGGETRMPKELRFRAKILPKDILSSPIELIDPHLGDK